MSTHAAPGPRMPLVASALLGKLAENWWLLLLRGLAAIAFGVIAFLWPGITLVALTYLFGIYAIVDGVVAIWAAFNAPADAGPRWWLGLSGVVSILAGIVAFAYTGVTALVLLVFIAVWAIIIGVLQLYAAIRLLERYRQRLVADLERSALDCFRRGADRLAEHRSTGGYLDDRLVCGLFRMHVHRPGVRAEEVQANLMVMFVWRGMSTKQRSSKRERMLTERCNSIQTTPTVTLRSAYYAG